MSIENDWNIMAPGGRLVEAHEICDESATQQHAIGTRYAIDDRVFRYGHCYSTAALIRGGMCSSYNTGGTQKGAYIGVQTAGDYFLDWTVQTSNITLNQFKDGYALIQGGYYKKIKSNPATSSGSVCRFELYEPITATAATGKTGLIVENLYANVYNKSQVGDWPGLPVGVPLISMTANYYGWLQTWGPCALMTQNLGAGDANSEGVWAYNEHPGCECAMQSGDAYPAVAWNVPMNTTNTDGENWVMAYLRLAP
jgi:hypothetical protein